MIYFLFLIFINILCPLLLYSMDQAQPTLKPLFTHLPNDIKLMIMIKEANSYQTALNVIKFYMLSSKEHSSDWVNSAIINEKLIKALEQKLWTDDNIIQTYISIANDVHTPGALLWLKEHLATDLRYAKEARILFTQALRHPSLKTVQFLIKAGVTVQNSPYPDIVYLLFSLDKTDSAKEIDELLRILLELLAQPTVNVNARVLTDKTADTPLIRAVKLAMPRAAELLIHAGADTTLTDAQGKTALDYAHQQQKL